MLNGHKYEVMEIFAVFECCWKAQDCSEVICTHLWLLFAFHNLCIDVKDDLFDELSSLKGFILGQILRTLLIFEPEFGCDEAFFANVAILGYSSDS
jgi:hypothetical protein